MNSTRLPGKVMLPLSGEPLLFRMYERVKAAGNLNNIVIATTSSSEDDEIYSFCLKKKIDVYRGHPVDLIERHLNAGMLFKADAVVKIPSDCPLISPSVIYRVLEKFISGYGTYDYVSNLHPATYPDGNDVEVITISALQDAYDNAKKDFEREHTTPYLWENRDKFRIANVEWETGLDYSMTHRWTIDYYEDYLFIKKIYEELWVSNPTFEIDDILNLLGKKPELSLTNNKYNGVNWYRKHLNELSTITPSQTRFTEDEK